jgi:hypothetical protein
MLAVAMAFAGSIFVPRFVCFPDFSFLLERFAVSLGVVQARASDFRIHP